MEFRGCLLIVLVLRCLLARAQHCVRNTDNSTEVICNEVVNFADLSEELDPSWRYLTIINRQQKSFTLSAGHHKERNFVEILDVSNVGELILAEDGFTSFAALKQLNVSGAHLEELRSEHFASDNSLENFDASWNELRLLSPELRLSLKKTRYANFSHNSLYTLDGAGCEMFSQLEILHLDNNEFKEIFIADCPKLRHLSLNHNLIELMYANNLQHLATLTDLHISANYLRGLEDGTFGTLAGLSLLNLSDNSLRTLKPDVFSGLSQLLTLDLHGNDLTLLVAQQFRHVDKLQNLDLSSNSISSLDVASFHGLVKLRKLFLQRNDIVSIAGHTFANLVSLDNVDLSQNSIAHLDAQAFGTSILPRFGKLNLNTNNLKLLEVFTFSSMPFLWYLSLGNNELSSLDLRMFAPMRLLRKLHLGNNLIEHITPEVLDSFRDIAELLIDNNKLTYLPDVNSTFPNLRKVAIEGNPWQCPCYLELVKWLQAMRVEYVRKNSPYYQGERPICVVTSLEYCVQNPKWEHRDAVVDEFERDSSPIFT